jgi:hypothetical protein
LGGAAHNLYVAVHGPAVEAGLVRVDKVQLYTGRGPQKGGASFEATAERRTTGEGKPALVADFPEGDLPASNAGGPQALAGVGAPERIEISMRANISVTIQGSAAIALKPERQVVSVHIGHELFSKNRAVFSGNRTVRSPGPECAGRYCAEKASAAQDVELGLHLARAGTQRC